MWNWWTLYNFNDVWAIFAEITSLEWNGVPFPPRLQKHTKCKQNTGILDAPLASEMLNSIPTMWFLMNPFHFQENGRKPRESRPFRWDLAFWGQRGIKNTFVLLAFPMVSQPAGERAPIWTKVCGIDENYITPMMFEWFSLKSQVWNGMGYLFPPGCKSIRNASKTKVFWMPRWPPKC